MFGRAFALYRQHFGALLLTSAIALVPADLLMAGAVRFGLATLGASRAGPREPPPKDELKSPDVTGAARADRARVLGQSLDGRNALEDLVRKVVPLLYAWVVFVSLLIAGLTLAHAALVPLVLDVDAARPSGPARAWAAVALRLGGLLRTWVLALLLVAFGTLFCIVPGVVLAAGFSFAAPVTMLEGRSGRDALERSWALMKGHWPRVLAAFALIVLFTAAASAAARWAPGTAWKLTVSAVVRLVLYPLPLVALVLVYGEVASTSGAAPLPGSSARGSAGTSRP
ncbi:MAG TPA: hypothetical protein VLW85_24375 [Myxococcales bacterium]|nr:hypothetical protein [Myxococcales bacterium]